MTVLNFTRQIYHLNEQQFVGINNFTPGVGINKDLGDITSNFVHIVSNQMRTPNGLGMDGLIITPERIRTHTRQPGGMQTEKNDADTFLS